jgi:cytochrome P450
MEPAAPPHLDAGTLFLMEAFAPENRADPYPLYQRMREQSPVLDTGINMWVTFSHGDCWTTVRSPEGSSDERRGIAFQREMKVNPRFADAFEREPGMLFADPPRHTRLRALVSKAFTPSTVNALRDRTVSLTTDICAQIAEAGRSGVSVDVIESIAYPLPIAIISDLMGVPEADRHQFRAWSTVLARSVDPGVLRSDELNAAIDRVNLECGQYCEALLDERRHRPGDDLISALSIATDGDDRLTSDEIVELCVLLLIAGHETTSSLIGNAMLALLRHPDQRQLLAEDASLLRNAVDELLRYDTPVQLVQRVATQPMRLGDVTIPEGDQVLVTLAAANRDPAVFDEPDRLDLRRENAVRHLSFGGGIHHCLGAALARTEAQIVIGELVHRFPMMELAAEPVLRESFNLRGLDRLLVTI